MAFLHKSVPQSEMRPPLHRLPARLRPHMPLRTRAPSLGCCRPPQTITTVGYGNVTPQTNGGRCFLMVYAVMGIGLVTIFFSEVAETAHTGILSAMRIILRVFGSVFFVCAPSWPSLCCATCR